MSRICLDGNEEWRQVPGWPWYEVSTFGRVKRIAPGRGTRVGYIMKAGGKLYPAVALRRADGSTTWFKTCVLVLMAFIGPRPAGKECCHDDDNKQNNRLDNLRWDTHKANGHDALRNGVMAVGERTAKAKLTPEIVRRIRAEHIPGRHGPGLFEGSSGYLAQKYGVGRAVVLSIAQKRSWKHIE